MSLIFEQWLIKNPVNVTRFFSYVSIYHVIYILPFVLLLVAYQLFSPKSRVKEYQLAMKYAAGLLLIITSVLLIAYPLVLSHRYLSLGVFIGAILAGYLIEKYYEKRRL